MNTKFITLALAIAVTGQSAHAGVKDVLKEIFVNWPVALAPSIWLDGKKPEEIKDNGQKFQIASNVMYNATKNCYITNEIDANTTEPKQAVGNFGHDVKGRVFVLDNNDHLIPVDQDGKVNNVVVPNAVFVVEAAGKISKQERIENYFRDEVEDKDSPAKAFNWWKHQHVEKRWFVGSSLVILLGVAAAAKKGYDVYQKYTAKQAAVDFDEFEEDEEEAQGQPSADKPAVAAQAAQ